MIDRAHLQLIDHVLSGNGTAAQRDEFSALVLADAVFTAAAARHAAMLAEIHERFTGAVVTTIEPTAAPSKPDAERQRGVGISRSPRPIPFIIYPISIAAAALLTAAIVVVYLLAFTTDPQPDPIKPNQPGPAVATLIQNTGDLRTPHGYPAEGDDYGRGEYSLSTGTAEFMLTNSVNVKLHGDTRMHMRNDMNVVLARGSAEFVCPTDAKGFTVHLPDASKIIDLGTAFRVDIDDHGAVQTEVLDGLVRFETPHYECRLEAGTVTQIASDETAALVVQRVDQWTKLSKQNRRVFDLSELGSLDWVYFEGHDGAQRVEGELTNATLAPFAARTDGSLIGELRTVGPARLQNSGGPPEYVRFDWEPADASTLAPRDSIGASGFVQVLAADGTGLAFDVQSDTAPRTIWLVVAEYKADGLLSVSWDDATSPGIRAFDRGGAADRDRSETTTRFAVFRIDCVAPSAASRLRVRWTAEGAPKTPHSNIAIFAVATQPMTPGPDTPNHDTPSHASEPADR